MQRPKMKWSMNAKMQSGKKQGNQMQMKDLKNGKAKCKAQRMQGPLKCKGKKCKGKKCKGQKKQSAKKVDWKLATLIISEAKLCCSKILNASQECMPFCSLSVTN